MTYDNCRSKTLFAFDVSSTSQNNNYKIYLKDEQRFPYIPIIQFLYHFVIFVEN